MVLVFIQLCSDFDEAVMSLCAVDAVRQQSTVERIEIDHGCVSIPD